MRRGMKILLYGIGIFGIALIPFFLWLSTRPAPPQGRGNRPLDGNDYFSQLGVMRPSQKVKAPELSLESLDGEQVRLSDFRGRVVFLNFWATWCGPCKIEVKDIDRLHRTLGEEDFAVVAVDIQENPRQVRQFMQEYGIDFPVYLDREGRAAARWGITGIPTTYIVDPRGYLAGKAVGPREWGDEDSVALMRSLME